MMFTVLLTSVLVILFLFYLFIKNKYNYWKKKNMPYLEPTLFLGNYGSFLLQKEFLGGVTQKICKEFPHESFVGAYVGTKPVLIPVSPEAVRLVTTQAFPHFNSRELMDYNNKELIGRGLPFLYGEEWKSTRSNLTPIFSASKLKNMHHLTEKCSNGFKNYIKTEYKNKTFEARSLISLYTVSIFVSCAFGIEINYGEDNDFNKLADMFFTVSWIRGIFLSMRMVYPGLFYGVGLKTVPPAIAAFFKKLLTEVFEARGNRPSGRNDFVDSLLELKEQNIDDDYIMAQCVAIFLTGFETSATTSAFVLYELAKHEEIQEKAHEEIDRVLKKSGGQLTFESLSEFPYLEACTLETLRRYPLVSALTREVTKAFTLPTGCVVEQGLRVHIPVYYLHHNAEYFPNPEEFRPERFYGDEKQDIVPYTFLPFGEGPRSCIGKRFGMVQSISSLVTVLRDHKVALAEGMPRKVEFESQTITTMAKNGIHLKLLPRT